MGKKEIFIDELNHLMGLMIAKRTVETSALEAHSHWVNDYIEKISTIRNNIEDNLDICESCMGDGCDYPKTAETILDAQKCSTCNGHGFMGMNNTQKLLLTIPHCDQNCSVCKAIELLKEKYNWD